MSQENVETLRRALEAFNRGDIDAALEALDAEVEWYPAVQPALGESTVYRGHQGARDLFRELNEVYLEFQIEDAEFQDLADRVVVTCRIRGRGKQSGAEADSPFGYLFDFRNGAVVRVRAFLDPNEALAAAGQRE
jgi:ketosteroid isomerase-like protein